MKAGCAGTILKDFHAKVHGHDKFARVIQVIMSGLYKSCVLYFILMVEKVEDGCYSHRLDMKTGECGMTREEEKSWGRRGETTATEEFIESY